MKEKTISDIVDLSSAFYGSAILFSALENGIFTLIEEGEPTLDSLAGRSGCDPRGLRLLLDACVALGLLKKEGERYGNTEAGKMALVAGGPADLTQAITYNRDVYPAWGKLSQLVKSGKPVEAPALHLGEDKGRTRRFALSMRGRALAIGRSVVPMIDLGGCRNLLDLAGGPGTYAELLARANPGLHGVTVDLPAISEVAREQIDKAQMAGSVECRAGDYHTDTYEEEGYEAVTLFGALHQESPEAILSILKRSWRALKPGGRIFILDMMTDATRTAPSFSALFAVNMALTARNGWVFSDRDIRGWLTEAGFLPGETRPLPPPMPHWLIEAKKV